MTALNTVVDWIAGVASGVAEIIAKLLSLSADSFWAFFDTYWMPVFAAIGLILSIAVLVSAYRMSSPDRIDDGLTALGHAVRFVMLLLVFVLIGLVVAIALRSLPNVST